MIKELKRKRFIKKKSDISTIIKSLNSALRPSSIRGGVTFSLLFIVFLGGITARLALLQVLSLNATSTSATERRLEREVNVLLAVQTNDERRDVDDLLADTVWEWEQIISAISKDWYLGRNSIGIGRG